MNNIPGVTIVSSTGVQSFVLCEPGKTSDGYHSIDELYEHRCLLFAALLKSLNDSPNFDCDSWKSRLNADGTAWESWFLCGATLPTGNISYHMPAYMWDMVDVNELPIAPPFDGHTAADVADRLTEWLGGDRQAIAYSIETIQAIGWTGSTGGRQ